MGVEEHRELSKNTPVTCAVVTVMFFGYLYFAMAFSAFVEILNIKIRKGSSGPVQLRSAVTEQ